MIEFPEEPGDTSPKSITDQLIEAIKDLSNSQQEKLLEAIHKWKKDSREYPRKDCHGDVIYSDNNRLAQGMIMNISAGGLYVQPDSPFAVGREVILSFEHPFTEKQVKVTGKIVRSDQNGFAIKLDQSLDNI